MIFFHYKEWYISVFGSEAAGIILDDINECISRDENVLKNFFKKAIAKESTTCAIGFFIFKLKR